MIGDLHRAGVGCLHELVGRVVVHDLGRPTAIDRDFEEVGEVAVALGCDACRTLKAHVVVVHRVRCHLHDRGAGGGAGDGTRGAVGRKDDLRHEHVPGLVVVAARIDLKVRSVPDCVRPSGAAGLDPREHIGGVACGGGSVADLDRSRPARPAAGRARRAHEYLTLGRVGAAHGPHHFQVAPAVDRKNREERVRRSVGRVGDLDQLGQVLAAAGRIEEVQRSGDVRRADVQVEAGGRGGRGPARLGIAGSRLEHLAGDLVDGRIPVGPEG